jgi:hypothetical protein
MKAIIATLAVLLAAAAIADNSATDPPAMQGPAVHRYLIERTFSAGVIDGLDAATKAKINATNAQYGVHWLMSYANASKTKTYCLYEGPSVAAIREAAKANNIPVDSVTEVPVTLLPR